MIIGIYTYRPRYLPRSFICKINGISHTFHPLIKANKILDNIGVKGGDFKIQLLNLYASRKLKGSYDVHMDCKQY